MVWLILKLFMDLLLSANLAFKMKAWDPIDDFFCIRMWYVNVGMGKNKAWWKKILTSHLAMSKIFEMKLMSLSELRNLDTKWWDDIRLAREGVTVLKFKKYVVFSIL